MTRLMLADLRHHAGTWAWTCVVAVVAGACVAGQLMVLHGSLATAARATGRTAWGVAVSADKTDAAHVVTGFILATVVLAAAAVLSSTASLALAQRQRDHGLWRALGMSPARLRLVLLTQLAVVGALGSLGGAVLGWPVARLMLPMLIDQDVAMPGTTPVWQAVDLLVCALIVGGSVLIGGWGAARRSSRAAEVSLLRVSGEARPAPAAATGPGARAARGGARRFGGLGTVLGALARLLLAAGCAAGVVFAAGVVHRPSSSAEDVANAAILGPLSALVVVCVLSPWIVPLLERGVAMLPARGPSWLVASRTAALESRRSSTTVLPFVVAIGLVAVMFGASAAGLGNMRVSGFLSMFGPAFVTAWSGGVAVIAMSASRRVRDAALLRAAGAQESEVLGAQVLEGALHAGCAIVIGLVVSVVTSAFMAGVSHRGVLDVVAHGPWAELGAVGGLTVATTCLAVVLTARAARGQSVGQVLRARE